MFDTIFVGELMYNVLFYKFSECHISNMNFDEKMKVIMLNEFEDWYNREICNLIHSDINVHKLFWIEPKYDFFTYSYVK